MFGFELGDEREESVENFLVASHDRLVTIGRLVFDAADSELVGEILVALDAVNLDECQQAFALTDRVQQAATVNTIAVVGFEVFATTSL